MNSARLVSPADRVAVARVAGNALGTMVVEMRLRGQVITREAIDTVMLVSFGCARRKGVC